jgi:hypothetical protein
MAITGNEDHEKISMKYNRMLPEDDLLQFMRLEFLSTLNNRIGEFCITAEDRQRSHEIYWRLVRPNKLNDVGPLHADAWFWKLNYKNDKHFASRRIKIWIPIFNDHDEYGFQYIPFSHKIENDFSMASSGSKIRGEYKGNAAHMKYHEGAPGNAIIFHDNLIHGGAVGRNQIRVSVEFTAALIET